MQIIYEEDKKKICLNFILLIMFNNKNKRVEILY